jgi:hypothetical protein
MSCDLIHDCPHKDCDYQFVLPASQGMKDLIIMVREHFIETHGNTEEEVYGVPI